MVKKFTEAEKKLQGNRLKEIRETLGFSRKEFAEAMWMESVEDLKSMELGKASIKGPVKQLLVIKFNVRVEYLTLGIGNYFTASEPYQNCQPHPKIAAEIEPGDPGKKKKLAEKNKRGALVAYPHQNLLLSEIEGWLIKRSGEYSADQFEWLKGVLENEHPDFREYLKKYDSKNLQNGNG